MKLRCTNNSIRLRLRKSDIHSLKQDASVSESLNLGNQLSFSYSLSLNEKVKEVSAAFVGQSLEILVPKDMGIKWMESDEVGIEILKNLEDESTLHILIEKDFPCLDRKSENKADTFWELTQQEKPEKC